MPYSDEMPIPNTLHEAIMIRDLARLLLERLEAARRKS